MDRFLVNDRGEKIKIPKSVVKVLEKMHGGFDDPERVQRIMAANIFALALRARRLEGAATAIKLWNEQGRLKSTRYPECKANTVFVKFISTTLGTGMFNIFSNKEVEDLYTYFATCPHGFDVKTEEGVNVWASSELQALVT
ncbi:hypothetical protein ABEX29_02715 [Brevibacillus porteri]|uniref:hypothetical protein n=1 Tax=Brevibacillus porteri TaxID=2126350 RepID=UPI003D242959